MTKLKLRKGDNVVVLQGKDRGKTGTISRVLPKEGKVIVDGVNVAKKHQRPTRSNQQGGIIDKDMPLPVSAVALFVAGKPSRVGYGVDSSGKKVRIAKRNGSEV